MAEPTRLSASDTVLWELDKDPQLRSTITAVALLDGEPDRWRLERRLDQVTHVMPQLRQRVVEPWFGVGAPSWVDDPGFDLDYHLRRVRVPAPGGLREVLDVSQWLASTPFDPARPLWEFTVLEGLAGGGAALVQKLHHCLTDGVGGIELAMLLLDADADAPEPDLSRSTDRSPPTPARTWATPLGGAVRTVARLPVSASSAAVSALRDPATTMSRGGELATSLVRMLQPMPPSSPLLRARGLARRFHTLELPLEDLRAAAHAVSGTVNDALLASVIGGLRQYHAAHEVDVEQLSVTMPVSLRRAGDELGGNRFTPARFTVPAAIGDPVERIARLGEIAHSWQRSPALRFSDMIAELMDKFPPALVANVMGSLLKSIDTVVTDVPGVTEPCFLAGAEVRREFAFAPTSGAALNVALVSHRDVACVGVVVDVAAAPDHDVLMDSLVAGFDEVVAISGRSRLSPT